jgi:hypothetical protein
MNTMSKTAVGPTEAQWSYIQSLMEAVYGKDMAPEAMEAFMESEPTKADASAKITALKEAKSAKAAPTSKGATTSAIPNGVHMIDGYIIRIRTSKSGNQYGERLLTQIEQEEHGTEWSYEGRKALKGASAATVLTLAQAKAFGVAYGVCAVCGARLKDIDSIEAGIGPVCAKKF